MEIIFVLILGSVCGLGVAVMYVIYKLAPSGGRSVSLPGPIAQLVQWIAAFGQNIQAVAACAHFFAAGYLIFLFSGHALWAAVGITVYAAVKEFWFDAHYEANPPQTTLDNFEDFAGYAAGAWITYAIVRLGG